MVGAAGSVVIDCSLFRSKTFSGHLKIKPLINSDNHVNTKNLNASSSSQGGGKPYFRSDGKLIRFGEYMGNVEGLLLDGGNSSSSDGVSFGEAGLHIVSVKTHMAHLVHW